MRSRATSLRSVVVVAMVGIYIAIALAVSVGANAESYTTASYSARLLTLVNSVRQQHGEEPLALTSGTTAVAQGWTQHLAAAGVLSHNPRLAHDLSTHGSHSWLAYGENVGMGAVDDPDGLFAAYMKSPEHRANILSNDYRYVGLAVVFTGTRAWNTFDFVDVYRVAPPQPSRQRPHAAAASLVTHSVARSVATVPTPPVRPSHRAARRAGPVVVHVEGLRHRAMRRHVGQRPMARFSTEFPPPLSVATVAPAGDRIPSRQRAFATAAALLGLVFGSRRWLLVSLRPRVPMH